jgi:hypothetical protein
MHLSVSPCKPLLLASDLAEACEDEEFVVNDMQANEISNKGLKARSSKQSMLLPGHEFWGMVFKDLQHFISQLD